MAKLFSEPLDLVVVTHSFIRSKQKNQIFKISSSQINDMGASMIELLFAVFLALFAAGTSAQLMNNLSNSGLNRRAAATSAIEVAISNDLAWFRQYAVLWRLGKGPYVTLPPEVTKTSYTQIPPPNTLKLSNKYTDLPGCGTAAMANAFQNDASNIEADFDSIKKPPYKVPKGAAAEKLDLPKSASDYKLERKIQPDDDIPGTLTITYNLTKSGSNIFERSSSLYLPAAGWCPP